MSGKAEITNEMIYTMLQQMQRENNARFDAIEGHLDSLEERFSFLEERFGSLEERFAFMSEDFLCFKKDTAQRLGRIESRLDTVYDERKEVTVKFTQAWAGASFGIACVAAFVSVGVFGLVF